VIAVAASAVEPDARFLTIRSHPAGWLSLYLAAASHPAATFKKA
jgi:hypothetical protein